MVPVLKADGQHIRICGDFNGVSDTDLYSITVKWSSYKNICQILLFPEKKVL